MSSIYTDDSRLVRYEKLRKKKKILEWILDAAMLIALLLAAGEVVPNLLESVLGSLTSLRDMGTVVLALAAVACMAAAIYAIYKKNCVITLAVLVLTAALIGTGAVRYWGILQPLPLGTALICHFLWIPLTKEEGYPQFQLEVNRHQATEQAWDFSSRQRAVETGARTAPAAEDDKDMRDLLSEGADVLNAELHGYRERSQGADPLVHAAEQHDSAMDSLEEL